MATWGSNVNHEMVFEIIFSSSWYWGGSSRPQRPQPGCSHRAELEASFSAFLSALRGEQAATRGLGKSGSLYGHRAPRDSLREKGLVWSGDVFMIIRDVMGSNSKENCIK